MRMITMKNFLIFLSILFFIAGCTAGKNSYNPNKKFSPKQLHKDYELFQNILQELHPSLYWYTPKDSVDYYFEMGESKLKDSLFEYQFRNVLSYVVAKIRCGHTTVRASKAAIKYSEKTKGLSFPLNIKAWKDTVVITSNLSKKDTNVMRGSLLKSIDEKPTSVIIDSMFQHISADGYNMTHKYQTISNSSVFRSMYGSFYGLKLKTPIEFIDTSGMLRKNMIGLAMLIADSTKLYREKLHSPSKKQRKKDALNSMRSMKIDTSLNTAFMEVNTFSSGNKLRSFFKKSFQKIRKEHVQNLVVDLRGNGGGSVILSNLLTKYISGKPFKIADSLYAVKRKSRYKKYIDNYFLNHLFLIFFHTKNEMAIFISHVMSINILNPNQPIILMETLTF